MRTTASVVRPMCGATKRATAISVAPSGCRPIRIGASRVPFSVASGSVGRKTAVRCSSFRR